MTELFLIILQFFIIYFLLSFNILVASNNNSNLKNFSLPENISFNSIVFINLVLVFSFFNINLNEIILCYLLYLGVLLSIYIYKGNAIVFLDKKSLFYFLLLFVTSIVIFFEVANNLIIGWDAQKFWIYKTLNFYNDNSITNLKNLPNSWYPYLGSLTWSFFWKIGFLQHEYSGRLFYVFIYLSSLLLIVKNFEISKSYKTIFFVFMIIVTYDYTYHSHWSIFGGMQEILIFSLLTISIHCLYDLSNKTSKRENLNIVLILLICNSLLWIKHEGFVISTSIILVLILFFNFSKKKKLCIFALFSTTILFRFLVFEFYDLNSSGIQHVSYDLQNSKGFIEKISIERILLVLKHLFLNLFTNYLILAGIFLLILFRNYKSVFKKIMYIIFLLLFNILSFCFIFLITDADLNIMLNIAMNRIIYQISPFVFLLYLEFFKTKKFLN